MCFEDSEGTIAIVNAARGSVGVLRVPQRLTHSERGTTHVPPSKNRLRFLPPVIYFFLCAAFFAGVLAFSSKSVAESAALNG